MEVVVAVAVVVVSMQGLGFKVGVRGLIGGNAVQRRRRRGRQWHGRRCESIFLSVIATSAASKSIGADSMRSSFVIVIVVVVVAGIRHWLGIVTVGFHVAIVIGIGSF